MLVPTLHMQESILCEQDAFSKNLSDCPCLLQRCVHDYRESAKKKDGMAAVFGAVFFSLERSLTPVCLVWRPVEGDKPLSLIHACFLLSNKFSGSFFFSSALLVFRLKYCFYEK